jgi:hypothetical protein
MSKAEAERLRQEAAKHRQDREDSFERSDTDGFLSQWASGLSAQLKDAQAQIEENDGMADHRGLFRKSDGKRIRAKIIDSRYGRCWAICGADGEFTGQFFPTGENSRKQKAAGLYEDWEQAPSWAKFGGSGYGLSGQAWVEVYRKDGGYPEDAVDF